MFYVLDPNGYFGPYSYDEARKVQNQCNARFGVDKDGEGYCNAIVIPAAMLSAVVDR